jgi:hypothetical protein
MSLGFAIGLPPLPPSETPPGAPGLGFLIAYEDPEAEAGWSTGIVEAIEEGCEGRVFRVKTRTGLLQVSRGLVFYWWPPGRAPAAAQATSRRSGSLPRDLTS